MGPWTAFLLISVDYIVGDMVSAKVESSVLSQFETGHQDTVHDAELDFYGKHVATCSSDRLVKVFSVSVRRYAIGIVCCLVTRVEVSDSHRLAWRTL
jgi:hypothetical protein